MNKEDIGIVKIPFGTDSELIEETITIPEGCYAIIKSNKVIIRKGKDPISSDLEKAATHAAYHQFYDSNDNYIAENEKEKFIEGAKWQKKQYDALFDEELDKAALKYYLNYIQNNKFSVDSTGTVLPRDMAKFGALWKERRLLPMIDKVCILCNKYLK